MPRLEHIQLLHPDDRGRFARAGIAASVQPIHLRADAAAARRLWGARAEANGYPWRSHRRHGRGRSRSGRTRRSSRSTRGRASRWRSPAATRRGRPDAAPFGPDEALTLERAIRAACVAPAVTAGERDRGRLVPGQRADLVVLPIEALTEPVEPGGALATARPRLVLVDGAVGFEA